MSTRNATESERSRRRQVPDGYDRPLTLFEAAAWLNVPEDRLAEWCKRHRIGHFRPSPGVYLFVEADLWEFLREHQHQRTTVKIKRATRPSLSMTREGR